MNQQRTLTALAVAMAFCAGSGWAQTSGSTGATGSSAMGGGSAATAQPGTASKGGEKVAQGDRRFIENAAEGGMFQVQAGKLAAARAQDAQVKDYANMLVDQHTKANEDLMKVASAKGVEMPAAPSRAQRNELDKLGKLRGAEFDRDFVRDVGIRDHQKDIKAYEKAQKDVKDPELKAWVDQTLPTLKTHLAAAEKLPPAESAAKMGASGSSHGSEKGGAKSGAGKTTY